MRCLLVVLFTSIACHAQWRPTPTYCKQDLACSSASACVAYGINGTCCSGSCSSSYLSLKRGQACSTATPCNGVCSGAGAACTNAVCTTQLGLECSCTTASQCASGYCYGGVCANKDLPVNETCASGEQCQTGYCNAQTHKCAKIPTGSACTVGSDKCESTSYCGQQGQNYLCIARANANNCKTDSCLSGYVCVNKACVLKGEAGAACNQVACSDANVCENNVCVKKYSVNASLPCYSSLACKLGTNCTAGVNGAAGAGQCVAHYSLPPNAACISGARMCEVGSACVQTNGLWKCSANQIGVACNPLLANQCLGATGLSCDCTTNTCYQEYPKEFLTSCYPAWSALTLLNLPTNYDPRHLTGANLTAFIDYSCCVGCASHDQTLSSVKGYKINCLTKTLTPVSWCSGNLEDAAVFTCTPPPTPAPTSSAPTLAPTSSPTTPVPTATPTSSPTSAAPSAIAAITSAPTNPTFAPTRTPTQQATHSPTFTPTEVGATNSPTTPEPLQSGATKNLLKQAHPGVWAAIAVGVVFAISMCLLCWLRNRRSSTKFERLPVLEGGKKDAYDLSNF